MGDDDSGLTASASTFPSLVLDVEAGHAFDLVVARGELDIATHQQLRLLLQQAELVRPLLAVDLTRVTFIDSLGIGALVLAIRWAMDRGAAVSLVAGAGAVTRMLLLAGLDQLLEIYPSVEALELSLPSTHH